MHRIYSKRVYSQLESLLKLKYQDLSGKYFNKTNRNEHKNNTENVA